MSRNGPCGCNLFPPYHQYIRYTQTKKLSFYVFALVAARVNMRLKCKCKIFLMLGKVGN
jgi:hypothetical protein